MSIVEKFEIYDRRLMIARNFFNIFENKIIQDRENMKHNFINIEINIYLFFFLP